MCVIIYFFPFEHRLIAFKQTISREIKLISNVGCLAGPAGGSVRLQQTAAVYREGNHLPSLRENQDGPNRQDQRAFQRQEQAVLRPSCSTEGKQERFQFQDTAVLLHFRNSLLLKHVCLFKSKVRLFTQKTSGTPWGLPILNPTPFPQHPNLKTKNRHLCERRTRPQLTPVSALHGFIYLFIAFCIFPLSSV